MSQQMAGDVNYEVHGVGYASQRRTDPRIAARVHQALGSARTILNVGAGAGSYEPIDRYVIAIEPSANMRSQRPAHLSPAIHGVAEQLPLDDQSVDAAMAMVTIHQWSNLERGIAELKRVSRGPIVLLTFDGDALDRFWLADYAPELIEAERKRYPDMDTLRNLLGGEITIEAIQIPFDCVDGFAEAYYARPEMFLQESVRRAQSAWTFITDKAQSRIVEQLSQDLSNGDWEAKYGGWRMKTTFEGSLRLIVKP